MKRSAHAFITRRIHLNYLSPLPATFTKRTLRVRCNTIAAASTKYSVLSTVIRPRKVTTFSPDSFEEQYPVSLVTKEKTALCTVDTSLRVPKIPMDQPVDGSVRSTHDVVGIVHTILLNGIHCRIDIAATTVEISSMHMDHQWLTRYLLGMYPCRISQPVMRMNDIKLLLITTPATIE